MVVMTKQTNLQSESKYFYTINFILNQRHFHLRLKYYYYYYYYLNSSQFTEKLSMLLHIIFSIPNLTPKYTFIFNPKALRLNF
jgi:hypothetical protein